MISMRTPVTENPTINEGSRPEVSEGCPDSEPELEPELEPEVAMLGSSIEVTFSVSATGSRRGKDKTLGNRS